MTPSSDLDGVKFLIVGMMIYMEGSTGRKVTWTGKEMPKGAAEAARRQEISPVRPTAEALALREELSYLDFGVIRQLFTELYERQGIDPHQMNFFDLENVSPSALFGTYGAYDPVKNTLGLNMSQIAYGAERDGFDPRTVIAATLLHEETHAVGRVECHFPEKRGNNPLTKYGYAMNVDLPVDDFTRQATGPGIQRLFQSFNEGVTEMIAHNLLEQYAERTGHLDLEKTKAYIEAAEKYSVYVTTQNFIAELETRTLLSKEELQEVILRQYFKENNFLEEMLADYPDLTEGEGYLARFARG